MLDFRMETFLEVCRQMNYTRAAQVLNLTQPAVSQHIRWLEEAYGTPLFQYANKTLTLTPAGQLLRSAATTVQHDQIYLLREMQRCGQGADDLSFGVTPTVGMFLIPEPLSRYHRRHPRASLRLQVDNTRALCQGLDEGRLDFAIVEGYVRKSDYDSILYENQPYVAVCARNYPFPVEPHRLADLLKEPLLVREEGSGNREIIRRSLSRKNFALSDFSCLIEVSDMNVLKELLMRGCGVGFLYRAAVEADLQAGRLRQLVLEDLQEDHDITFIWRRGSAFAQRYQQLYQQLRPLPTDGSHIDQLDTQHQGAKPFA